MVNASLEPAAQTNAPLEIRVLKTLRIPPVAFVNTKAIRALHGLIPVITWDLALKFCRLLKESLCGEQLNGEEPPLANAALSMSTRKTRQVSIPGLERIAKCQPTYMIILAQGAEPSFAPTLRPSKYVLLLSYTLR